MSFCDVVRVCVVVVRFWLVDFWLGVCILFGLCRGMLVVRDIFLWWMRRRDGRLLMVLWFLGVVVKLECLVWLVLVVLS